MSLIEFSMDSKWIPMIESGSKRSTTRTKRKCDVGDRFELNGKMYEIYGILPLKAWDAVHTVWSEEGFNSETEFRESLLEYYPELDESDVVYIHRFRKVVV